MVPLLGIQEELKALEQASGIKSSFGWSGRVKRGPFRTATTHRGLFVYRGVQDSRSGTMSAASRYMAKSHYQSCDQRIMFRYAALLLFSLLWSQGSVTATEPDLQVCGPNGTVTVTVFNTGSNSLTGVQLSVQMPPGVEYVVGTVNPATVTEITTTPANQPVFGVPDLPPNSNLTITFQVRATCAVINFLADESNEVRNTYTITWSGGGSASYTSATEYNITQPSLQYLSITNQSFNATTLPQTFTRTFTVTNAGTAPLSVFRHIETSGASVTILSSSGGTVITHAAHNLVLEFSGADLGPNNLFDPGETVTFSVTYEVTSCNAATSNFSLTWGCYSQSCQTVTQTGGVNFASLTPNLNSYKFSYIQESSCYGDNPVYVNHGRLLIRNAGLGPAKDIEVDLYVTFWPPDVYDGNNTYDRIDTNSIALRIGAGGTPLPRVITSAQSGIVHSCFTATDVVKKLKLYIAGPLNPGDTLFIDFNLYTCELPQTCPATGYDFYFHGVGGDVTYKSLCDDSYTHHFNWTDYNKERYLSRSALSGSGPGTVTDGQTFSYCFALQTEIGNITINSPDGRSESGSPSDPNNYQITWTIQLPAAFTYTGGPINWVNGALSWPANSVSLSGSTLTIVFDPADRPAGWTTFKNVPLCLPLQAVCGTPGLHSITASVSYNPNTTCNPSPGYCTGIPTTYSIALNCPIPCDDGIDFITFDVKRISYGLPDDDNDGQPSGATLNFAQMRLDRLMHTDTAEAFFGGRVRATNYPNWQNVWVILEAATLGDLLLGLNAEVTIRKNGSFPVYSFTRPVVTSPFCAGYPDCNRMAVDLRVPTLVTAGVVPPTFKYENNDSIEVRLRFRFETNIGGIQQGTSFTPYFYATTNPVDLDPLFLTPHNETERFSCRAQSASMELIGWYVTVGGPAEFQRYPNDPWDEDGCAIPFWAYYYLSIGPCCLNYCRTNNLFPYEYREWNLPAQFVINLPAGWSYAGAGDLIFQRTPGCINQYTGSGNANPVDPNTNPLVFNTLIHFTPSGGPLVPSDDGHFGLLYMRLRPSCQSRSNPERDTVTFTVNFTGRLPATASTDPILPYTLVYDAPRLKVEGIPDLVTLTGSPIEWTIKVSNLSNATTAKNAFLFFTTAQSNLTVTQVIDLNTSLPITPIGDIYPIGDLPASTDRYFKVRASFSNCTLDTLYAHAGWRCEGYPASAASYTCYNSAPRDTLRYIPTQPNVLFSSISIDPNPSNLCDILTIEVTLNNAGQSAAYQPALFMLMPPGIVYVPGSSEYLYPSSSTWQPLSDPTTFFIFRVWNLTTQTNPLGLTPTGPHSTIKVRFKVVSNCNYVSGLQIRFFLIYRNFCNQPLAQIGSSPIVSLANAIIPYNTAINIPNLSVSKCQDTLTYNVSVTNLGAGSTTTFDSIRVTFPLGVSYLPNSTSATQNFTTHEPQVSVIGSNIVLQWGLQGGHGTGTLIQYSFQVIVGPSLPTGTYPVSVQTLINATQTCGSSTCNSFFSTGTASANLTINRPAGLWTGNIDTDWYEPFNWGDCQIPTCAQDVVIPSSPQGGRFPVINNSHVLGAAECHDITVESGASLGLTGTGQLDICRHTTFQSGSLLSADPGSKVRFVGGTNQLYTFKGVGQWHNVEMAQSAPGQRLILLDPLEIRGTLTLNMGIIDGFTHNKETVVLQPAASAVTIGNLNSYISGVLRRKINTTAIDDWYYLPVGDFPSGRGYELAQLQFDNVPATEEITAAFYLWPGAPPSCAVKTDCGAPFGFLPNLNHGYWVINRTQGNATPYHLRVFSRGYTNAVGVSYAIVKRPTGSGATFDFEGDCEGSPYDQAHQTGRLHVPDFSEFAVAQSDQPLPAQRLILRADVHAQNILLHFTAELVDSSEVSFYEVRRRGPGEVWQTLVRLSPHTAYLRSASSASYRWNDLTALPNTPYIYQVIAMGPGGEQKLYSNAVEAMISSEAQLFWLQPNPSYGSTWLMSSQSDLYVEIVDVRGQVVWQGRTIAPALELPANLAAGVYIVKVADARLRWVKLQ